MNKQQKEPAYENAMAEAVGLRATCNSCDRIIWKDENWMDQYSNNGGYCKECAEETKQANAKTSNLLPTDILEWTQHEISEAISEGWIEQEEVDDNCDAIFAYQSGNNVHSMIWIQRIFDKQDRSYQYFTIVGRDSHIGSFAECVNLILNDIL